MKARDIPVAFVAIRQLTEDAYYDVFFLLQSIYVHVQVTLNSFWRASEPAVESGRSHQEELGLVGERECVLGR